jgi:hypothetical protein
MDRVSDPSWLVSFAAIWYWRQVRRIGLRQQAIVGNEPQKLVVRPLLEGHDAAEGDVPADVQSPACEIMRSRVAVQNANDTLATSRLYHRSSVVLGISGVHDNRQPKAPRKLQLKGEDLSLD